MTFVFSVLLLLCHSLNNTYSVQQAVWPHSGHYLPTEQNFNDFISFLRENNVDLTDVKVKKKKKKCYMLQVSFFPQSEKKC